MNVSLTPELEGLIREKVESGMYQTASEVVREGLRLLRDRDEYRQQRLEGLRREIQIGVDEAERGQLAPFDRAAIKAKGRQRLALADLRREIAVGIDAVEREEYLEFSSTDELLEALLQRATSALPPDEAHRSQ